MASLVIIIVVIELLLIIFMEHHPLCKITVAETSHVLLAWFCPICI